MNEREAKRGDAVLTAGIVALMLLALVGCALVRSPKSLEYRERERRTRYASDMRQIGMALELYASEYVDRFPRSPDEVDAAEVEPAADEVSEEKNEEDAP